MRITFLRTGGFAGMRLSSTIDTLALPGDEARVLEELVETAGFFDLPGTMPAPAGGADRFLYHIAIEAPAGQKPARQHTVDVSEAALTQELQPLIDRLMVLARTAH